MPIDNRTPRSNFHESRARQKAEDDIFEEGRK